MKRVPGTATRLRGAALAVAVVVTAYGVWVARVSAATSPSGVEEWVYLAQPGGPAGRQGASLSYDAGRQRMILFGGYDGFRDLNDVWELSLPEAGAAQWRKLEPAGKAPAGRDSHVAAVDTLNDRLVVFGGQDRGTGTFMSDVHFLRLSPGAEEWTTPGLVDAAPSARAHSAGVYDATGRRLVIFGGWDDDEDSEEVWGLALPQGDGAAWRRLQPAGAAPLARDGHLAVADAAGDRMLLFGGYTRWTTQLHSDVFALTLTPGAEAWAQLARSDEPGPISRLGSVGVFDAARGRLVVLGGGTLTQSFDDIWAFEPYAGGWTALTVPGGPGVRGGPAVAHDARNGRLILVGGYAGEFRYAADVWGLKLAANVPTPTPSWTSTATATSTPTASATSDRPPTTTAAPTETRTAAAYLPALVLMRLPPPTATPTPLPCTEEEVEPNRTLGDVDARADLCPDATVRGVLPQGDDWDFYRIEVLRPGELEVDLWNLPAHTDYDLYVYDAAGDEVAFSRLYGTDEEHILLTAPRGRYYLRVFPAEGRSPQSYRLRWFLH